MNYLLGFGVFEVGVAREAFFVVAHESAGFVLRDGARVNVRFASLTNAFDEFGAVVLNVR